MEATTIPLFPLSNVVLFPGVRAPLHVFEPRYRQMMEAALAADRLIGMAVVVPEHTDEMDDDPPLFPVGCAGFIRDHQRLADGRYNLVLQGTQRFRILAEIPREAERLYRRAEVKLLDDAPVDDADVSALEAMRHEVLETVAGLIAGPRGSEAASEALDALSELDHVRFVNELCRALSLPPADKQSLLEAGGVRERLDQLEAVLQFRLAAQRAGSSAGSGSVH